MKIVLARIFTPIPSLRERLLMSKSKLRSSGKPRRGGFTNGRALNVTKSSKLQKEGKQPPSLLHLLCIFRINNSLPSLQNKPEDVHKQDNFQVP